MRILDNVLLLKTKNKKAFEEKLAIYYDLGYTLFSKAILNEYYVAIVYTTNVDKKTIVENKKLDCRLKAIRCITTGKEFPSIKSAMDEYGISKGSILNALSGRQKYAGTLDGRKLFWERIE